MSLNYFFGDCEGDDDDRELFCDVREIRAANLLGSSGGDSQHFSILACWVPLSTVPVVSSALASPDVLVSLVRLPT